MTADGSKLSKPFALVAFIATKYDGGDELSKV